jgi:hypothetical protein
MPDQHDTSALQSIVIRGAREHWFKGVDVDIRATA